MAGPYRYHEKIRYMRGQRKIVDNHYSKGGPLNVLYRAALACTGRTPLAVIEAKRKAKARTKSDGGRN